MLRGGADCMVYVGAARTVLVYAGALSAARISPWFWLFILFLKKCEKRSLGEPDFLGKLSFFIEIEEKDNKG